MSQVTPATGADDMEVLAPDSISVAFKGQSLVIHPLSIGIIPAVVRELRPVIASLREKAATTDGVFDVEVTPELIMDLVVDYSEPLFTATALCSGQPVDLIRSGDPAEFIELAMAVGRVNSDFFLRRIVPLLGDLKGAFSKAARPPGDGQTPSSS